MNKVSSNEINFVDFPVNNEPFHIDRTGAPFFLDSYFKAWGSLKSEKLKDLYYPFGDLEQVYLFFQNDNFHGCWFEMKKFGKSILTYLIQGSNFTDYLKNKDLLYKNIDAIWANNSYEQTIAMSPEEAINFSLDRQSDLTKTWIVDPISIFVGEIITPYMEWWFDTKKIDNSERAEIFHVVLNYSKISATIERQMAIKKEIDGSQYSEKEKILDKLVKNFAYAKADFTGYIFYSKEDVLKEYEQAGSFNINIDDITKREKMFKSFDLTSTERKIFDIFAFCTFSRDERRAYQQKLFSLIDWSLRSLSTAYDIPLKFLKYATIDELSDQNLSSKKYKELLQKRFDGGSMIYWKTRGVGGYLLGDQAKEKFDSLPSVRNVNENDKEIKGQSAYRGNISGAVQVILDSKTPVPEEPFVLVTGMTSPDYIQHIQKCTAIITNEGGITCHAAILSRELKKPCIIGTKIATKVLKNGDLVEVDANAGVVRILKKAE